LWPKLNLLWSYAFIRKSASTNDAVIPMLCDHTRLLIDSGAFSDFGAMKKAAAQGTSYKPISLPEYMAFCRKYHGRVFQYIQLDKVQDPATSARNLAVMVDAGLKPMPVFVMGAPFESIPDLVAINEWICVAGGVGTPDAYIHPRFRRAFEASGGKAKIHGLGFTRWPDVFRLPIASGDSVTWCSAQMYGSLFLYDRLDGLRQVKRVELSGKTRTKRAEAFIGLARRCGVTYEQLLAPESYQGSSYTVTSAFGVYAMLRFLDHSADVGFKLFLAFSNANSHLCLLLATLSASDQRALDYQAARAMHDTLKRLWKTDKDKFTAACAAILREKTRWQEP
jgi:hypothetical protein